MKKESAKSGAVRSIGIEQWAQLAQKGDAPPVSIYLAGESMRPLVRKGKDLVTLAPVQRDVRRGDVVLLRDGAGRYVVHRVWKTNGQMVQTLGDGSWAEDAWIEQKSVLALAVAVKRGRRTVRIDNGFARLLGRVWQAGRPVRSKWRAGRVCIWRIYKKMQGRYGK